MSMKMRWTYFMLGVVFAGAAFWLGRQAVVRVMASTDLGVSPYIAESTHFSTASGVEKASLHEIVARRRDGAVHRSGVSLEQAAPVALRRVDFPDGYTGMFVDALKAKSTGRKSIKQVAAEKMRLFSPPVGCVYDGEVLDGEETLFGVRARRLVGQRSPDERRVAWRLPDLQCAEVQLFKQRRDGGGTWVTRVGVRLTAFAAVDPDPALFTDFALYEEMPPSQMKSQLFVRSGVTSEKCPECFGPDSSDAGYWQARKP